MKIAIIHDWLVTDAGAEKVLSAMLELYSDADVFSLVDFLSAADREAVLGGKYAKISFIQKLPFAKKYFRNYLALFPKAIESLDVSGYELVISSSWAVAKGVKKHKYQKHICYCHTPIRYAWDLHDEYTEGLPFIKKIVVKMTLAYLRRWDKRTASGVDAFAANSATVAERISRIYGRRATVIYPPVDTGSFTPRLQKEDFYLAASRLVPYKKTSLIVEAFTRMPDKKLVVIGSGEELNYIKKIATPNVAILGYQPKEVLVDYMQRAKAFVFTALEDFGITPVEAMACGTPVIAYGVGGASETVVDGVNGVHFMEQSIDSIARAVKHFESLGIKLDYDEISQSVQRFSSERFRIELKAFAEG